MPAGLLVAQVATVVVAWGVLWAAPDEPNRIETGTCKATETDWVDAFLQSTFIGSVILGGLAWATVSLGDRTGWGKLVGFAAVALVTPYVILVSWLWIALCGYYS